MEANIEKASLIHKKELESPFVEWGESLAETLCEQVSDPRGLTTFLKFLALQCVKDSGVRADAAGHSILMRLLL